jgi:hypothetical protein
MTHIYHYNTHAEKRYFLGPEHRDLYDVIALSGNIVSHSPAGTAAFLATAGKPFYIDPQTHAFQHATRHLKRDVSNKEAGEAPRYEFKPSIRRLADDRLGPPFTEVIAQDRPLQPNAFVDQNGQPKAEVIETVCHAVVAFQMKLMVGEMDDETLEYFDSENELQPEFIIAPYFFLGPPDPKTWLAINLASYKATRDLYPTTDAFLALLLPKHALDGPQQQHLLQRLEDCRPRGILLWIDDHKEEDLTASEALRYLKFLRSVKGCTDRLLVSHGGYLSMLACHPDIGACADGVGHAVNYGEYRSIVPIGGGIPMAHFYLRLLHSRLRHGDAASIIQPMGWLASDRTYTAQVCGCRQCHDLIGSEGSADHAFASYGESNPVTFSRRDGSIVRLNYPTTSARQAAARHYLYNKAREVEEIGSRGLQELLDDLKEAAVTLQGVAGVDVEMTTHLNSWSAAVRALLGES